MSQVLCNQCNEMITVPAPSINVLKNAIHEHYFDCPLCNHKYVTHYTDQRLRRDIKRQEKRWNKYREAPTQERKRTILAEINLNKRMLEKESAALKEKMSH